MNINGIRCIEDNVNNLYFKTKYFLLQTEQSMFTHTYSYIYIYIQDVTGRTDIGIFYCACIRSSKARDKPCRLHWYDRNLHSSRAVSGNLMQENMCGPDFQNTRLAGNFGLLIQLPDLGQFWATRPMELLRPASPSSSPLMIRYQSHIK